jgi:site-specific DNA recombinase
MWVTFPKHVISNSQTAHRVKPGRAGHTAWFRHNEKIKGGYRGGIKVRPRAEWEVHLNTHEAMISDVQAEMILAQRALKSANQQRGRRSPYLLAGLLRCVCGANFDGDAGYYKCHRRKDGCDSRSISQETIEHAVLGVLFDQYLTVEMFASTREQLVRLESTTGARHKRDIEGLGAQLKDVTRQIDTLIALLTEVEHRRPLLVASASLNGDDLTLVPNYPGITGVKMASPRGFEPRFSP